MIKNTYIVAFLLCTILSYGQQITFHKNVNYRASLLEQNLNTDRDSLILESKSIQIQKVEIFNKGFSESISVYDHKTKIDLKALPEGNFVIQVKIGEKWIVMSLEKNEDIKITSPNQNKQDLNFNGSATKHKSFDIASLDQKEHELNYIDLTSKQKLNDIAPSDQKDHDLFHKNSALKQKPNDIPTSDQKGKDLTYEGIAFKHKSYDIASSDQKEQDFNYEDIADIASTLEPYKIASLDLKEKDINHKGLASKHSPNKIVKKNNSAYYWVVSESNSSFGSSKSMRLEYKGDIDKLISKVKLELKSNVGKNNKLLVYEIYNRSKFMTKQLRNPGYYKSETSEVFNVVPFFASRN